MTRTDEKVGTVVETWFPRFLANGLDYLDVRRILDRVERWDDWGLAWSDAAEEYAALGESALEQGRSVTAADHLRRAALTLQFAQFVLTEDAELRTRLHRRQAELYRCAAPHLRPPAEPIELALDGAPLHGYLRRPAPEGRFGLVVLLPGLESTKEQFSTYEPYFLERGAATLSFEGPGQGEARLELPYRDEIYGRAVEELAHAIPRLPGVDPERLVVLGTSFGGYLALRHATAFAGVRGVIDIAGPYDLRGLAQLNPVVQDGFVHFTGASDGAEAADLLADVTLDGRLASIDAPVLVVHGGADRVIPVEHAHRIVAALGGRAQLHLEPDGSHSCNNLYTRIRPLVADWAAGRLDAGGR
jgi:2,6-dihydroxypseudooxynicotine hydrolase